MLDTKWLSTAAVRWWVELFWSGQLYLDLRGRGYLKAAKIVVRRHVYAVRGIIISRVGTMSMFGNVLFRRFLQFASYCRTIGVFESEQYTSCYCRNRLYDVKGLNLRTYKVKTSLKLMCPGCRFIKRKGKLRVLCSVKPRHKQRQGWYSYAITLDVAVV